MDQLVFDLLPDDPCHFIAVEFDNGVIHLNLFHRTEPLYVGTLRSLSCAGLQGLAHGVASHIRALAARKAHLLDNMPALHHDMSFEGRFAGKASALLRFGLGIWPRLV
jgi:hypothetical protein